MATKENEEIVYEKKWYIIHTYSGYEKKVATDLEKRIETLNLTDRVFRILVPEEEVLEEKRGKMVKVPRKLFPSYVMIEMLSVREENELGLGYRVDSEAWYVIRNTNGVTGFVGVGSDPIPLSDEEAENLLAKVNSDEKERLHIDFEIGENVVVKNDSFMNQVGDIVRSVWKTNSSASRLYRNIKNRILKIKKYLKNNY